MFVCFFLQFQPLYGKRCQGDHNSNGNIAYVIHINRSNFLFTFSPQQFYCNVAMNIFLLNIFTIQGITTKVRRFLEIGKALNFQE